MYIKIKFEILMDYVQECLQRNQPIVLITSKLNIIIKLPAINEVIIPVSSSHLKASSGLCNGKFGMQE